MNWPIPASPKPRNARNSEFDATLIDTDSDPDSLAQTLARQTKVGSLWRMEGDRIRCLACGHRCVLANGRRGICKVRFNANGELRVPFGYVAGLQCDPVEKKPFFHVYPGSQALTFGMLGCDFHCAYCQNWITSQALRDPASGVPTRTMTPEQIVTQARRHGARLIVSSYNEPLITAEWAAAVFAHAQAEGLACAFVSNGNATPEALDFLKPWLVAYKIDLKSFDDKRYRSLGGTLQQVTEAIQLVHARKIWLEVVTLVVPGFNDSPEELRRMARFIAGVSRDIPWHVTAFHPEYRMRGPENTNPALLLAAANIGIEEGLRFVYAGNLPGQVRGRENTFCPSCQESLITRHGFRILEYRMSPKGACSRCGASLPGVWGNVPEL